MEIKLIKVMNASLYHGVSIAWNTGLIFGQLLITSLYILAC